MSVWDTCYIFIDSIIWLFSRLVVLTLGNVSRNSLNEILPMISERSSSRENVANPHKAPYNAISWGDVTSLQSKLEPPLTYNVVVLMVMLIFSHFPWYVRWYSLLLPQLYNMIVPVTVRFFDSQDAFARSWYHQVNYISCSCQQKYAYVTRRSYLFQVICTFQVDGFYIFD